MIPYDRLLDRSRVVQGEAVSFADGVTLADGQTVDAVMSVLGSPVIKPMMEALMAA